jgi:ATP synthase protein I
VNQKRSGLYAYGAVGLQLNVSVLLGFFAGRWLDGKCETSPWFTVALISAGFVSGVLSLHRLAKRANRDEPIETPVEPDGKRGEDDHG